MRARDIPCPKESVEQQRVVEWARWQEGAWPELRNLYKITNEGKRSKGQGGRLVGEGLKKGVPDLCLAWPRLAGESDSYHGLYIEMKRERGGRLEPDQKDWQERLTLAGYLCVVAKGADEAIKVITAYLNREGAGR